jgi:aminopeptidase-like protein
MRELVDKVWLKNRAVVSDGFKESLDYISTRLPINIYEYPSRTSVFDWTIPQKWNLKEAYIEVDGERILDAAHNPLVVMIGSASVDKEMKLEELFQHIFIDNENPFSIPYMYEHYNDGTKWGFCMSAHATQQLVPLAQKKFRVVIDAEHTDGNMYVGEYVHRGESPKSIVLVAHLDHPAQVQDGLSGCAVLLDFAQNIIQNMKDNYYTYRVLFVPETLGSLAYLSSFPKRQDDIKFGSFFEMMGVPNQPLVLQDAFEPDTEIAHAFHTAIVDVTGQDEKIQPYRSVVVNDDCVFNAPGIEIPMVSLSRSASRDIIQSTHFKGYHTSADDVTNISWENMYQSLSVLIYAINILETNRLVKRKYKGIPHLSKHGLWISRAQDPILNAKTKDIIDMLRKDVTILDIARATGVKFHATAEFIGAMEAKGLIKTRRAVIDQGRIIGAK